MIDGLIDPCRTRRRTCSDMATSLPPPRRASPIDLYNALCNHCLVLDARTAPAFTLHGACAASEPDEWESPDDLTLAVLVCDAPAPDLSPLIAAVEARWRSLTGRVAIAAESAALPALFPWATSLATVPQPVSWPSCVGDRVFLGSALHAGMPTVLAAMNIRTVVNVMSDAGGVAEEDAVALGITHVRLPWEDAVSFHLLPHLPAAVGAILAGIGAGNVLVHCWRGASRSAAAIAAYLLWCDPSVHTVEAAAARLRAARSAVAINAGFVTQLGEWARAVKAAGGPGVASLPSVVAALCSE